MGLELKRYYAKMQQHIQLWDRKSQWRR